jgi:hypothetical protein
MRLRMNDERERRLRRLMEETGEKTKSGAIDTAMAHYLADKRNKEKAIHGLSDDAVEQLSTPQLPLGRDVTHTVGKD